METPPRSPGRRPGLSRWVGVLLLAAASFLLSLASPAHAEPPGSADRPAVLPAPPAGTGSTAVGTSGNRPGTATVGESTPGDAEELMSSRPSESGGGGLTGLLAVVATVCVVGVSVGLIRAVIAGRADGAESA